MLQPIGKILLMAIFSLAFISCGQQSTTTTTGTDVSRCDKGYTGDNCSSCDIGYKDNGSGVCSIYQDEPVCAASNGARCLYVAADGNDSAAGSIDAPFKTFHAAIELANPGDFIYARGGIYGRDNARIVGAHRLPQASFTSPCAEGQVYADNYCQVPSLSFVNVGDWNGYPVPDEDGHHIAAGEPGRPITLRNFPGELPILDMNALDEGIADDVKAALIARQKSAITIGKSHWVIQGLEVIGGSINLWGDIIDITIEQCHVHDLIRDGGDNPGLIRLNRGPEDVRIINNHLHGIYDHQSPTEWGASAEDIQHFGAVTTLSGETYGGTDDTGKIEIRDNEIYHVPQAFFFKNAAKGPILITNNHIYDSDRLASNVSANVSFRGNLVHGVRTGFWRQGMGFAEKSTLTADELAAVLAIDGHKLTIEYNTIIGLEDTLVASNYGEGHRFSNNVIFGLPGTATTAGWNTAAFVKVNEGALTPADSRLQTMSSDNNCFIVPDAGFQLIARYLPASILEHYDFAAAQSTFGFDINSTFIVSDDPTSVFVNPGAGNYKLVDTSGCGAVGHTALP